MREGWMEKEIWRRGRKGVGEEGNKQNNKEAEG